MSGFILLELRLAFRTCAVPRSSSHLRQAFFSTHRCLQQRGAAQSPKPLNPKKKSKLSLAKRPENTTALSQDGNDGLPATGAKEAPRDVGNAPRSYRDVDTGKQVPVPMKVLPKAQLTPELVLNAKERMQLEYITRRTPKREPGQVFRERLLIYHRGLSKTNWTVFIKTCTMVGMAFATCIAAPAYYTFGAPWWTVASILFVGCSPFLALTWRTRPLVTWIFLILPTFARQSPKAALEYARNLPDSARLQIHYMRTSGLPANVTVEMRDLKPVRSSPMRPVTFEWTGNRVDKGMLYRPNLTKFFVKEKSGTGKEKRDIIPGIWEPVYKRIMGAESAVSAKWKK
jgi:hypothetical protein